MWGAHTRDMCLCGGGKAGDMKVIQGKLQCKKQLFGTTGTCGGKEGTGPSFRGLSSTVVGDSERKVSERERGRAGRSTRKREVLIAIETSGRAGLSWARPAGVGQKVREKRSRLLQHVDRKHTNSTDCELDAAGPVCCIRSAHPPQALG